MVRVQTVTITKQRQVHQYAVLLFTFAHFQYQGHRCKNVKTLHLTVLSSVWAAWILYRCRTVTISLD